MKKTRKYYVNIRKSIFLIINKIRINIQIQRTKYFYRIIIPEKFKLFITILKFILTAISLLSCFIVFSLTIFSFLFGILMFLFLSLLERILFAYTSLYIHPFPDFEIESDKWTGISFGYVKQESNPYDIPCIGMLFSDENYALKIYNLILKWTYKNKIDEDKNVNVSVILLNDNSYVFFIYPNFYRKTAKLFFNNIEKNKNSNYIHQHRSFIFILGKEFSINEVSYCKIFKDRYQEDVPYILEFFVSGKDGNLKRVNNTEDIILFSLKFKQKNKLTRKDMEYDLFRLL